MTNSALSFEQITVIAPNLKRLYSGVTSTVIALLPIQRRHVAIVATGPGLPNDIPHVPVSSLIQLVRTRPTSVPFRIWHARRNVEMVAGILLRAIARPTLKLVFTSAAQRDHKRFTKWLIRQMDAVISTTARAASHLEVPSTIIPHGIDLETYRPASPGQSAHATEHSASDDSAHEIRWIGCFGRIRPNKGTDLFVDAMISILPDHPQLHAVILGRTTQDNADFTKDLGAKIAAAKLTERFHILGEVPRAEVIAWYRRLSLFVAPQRWEGFGLTVPEALASGIPVVATDVGAHSEFVEGGRVGRLVPTENGPALETAIRELLCDPVRLEQMGRTARARAEASFRIEQEAEKINAVYQHLWDEKRSL